MKLPNIKSFVTAVLKPYLVAIAQKQAATVKALEKLTLKNQEYTTSLETSISKLSEEVVKTNTVATEIAVKAEKATQALPTAEEVKQLKRRVQELDYFCGQVYDKMYELLHTGTVKDSYLINPDEGWLPSDTPKTDAELEKIWRASNGMSEDALLTNTQQAELMKYIEDYRKHHPSNAETLS